MLPPGPLSNVSTEDIIAEIRRGRITRVAATARATRPRGEKKTKTENALAALLDKAIADAIIQKTETEK